MQLNSYVVTYCQKKYNFSQCVVSCLFKLGFTNFVFQLNTVERIREKSTGIIQRWCINIVVEYPMSNIFVWLKTQVKRENIHFISYGYICVFWYPRSLRFLDCFSFAIPSNKAWYTNSKNIKKFIKSLCKNMHYII